jgi:DNA-binding transcriptional regulator WhiA
MEITKELSELIGIIIGDGNIHYNQKTRKYYIEITGNLNERKFFAHISNLFKILINKPGNIRINRGLRLRVYNKEFVEFLIYNLELHYNKGKCYSVEIPNKIYKNNNYVSSCLRGIFDTDGSYFLADKGYRKDYPCIEISTCSANLSKQIIKILENKFRVKHRTEIKENLRNRQIISLNGEIETDKWFDLIGSSNPNKLNKYLKFKSSKYLNNAPPHKNISRGGSSVWETSNQKGYWPKSTRLKI